MSVGMATEGLMRFEDLDPASRRHALLSQILKHRLAAILGIGRDDDGWFCETDYNIDPTGTERGGIHVAGVCQGPKDIPDAVAQASAVAARVLKGIVSGRGPGSRGSLSVEEIESRARALAGA